MYLPFFPFFFSVDDDVYYYKTFLLVHKCLFLLAYFRMRVLFSFIQRIVRWRYYRDAMNVAIPLYLELKRLEILFIE